MKKLNELRKLKKISANKMAKELNISRATYYNYESGITQPDFEMLKKIAKFFNVSTDYLLDYDNVIESTNKMIRAAASPEEALKKLHELFPGKVGIMSDEEFNKLYTPEDIEKAKAGQRVIKRVSEMNDAELTAMEAFIKAIDANKKK